MANKLKLILEDRVADLQLGNINIEDFTELVLADLKQDASEILETLEIEDPQ